MSMGFFDPMKPRPGDGAEKPASFMGIPLHSTPDLETGNGPWPVFCPACGGLTPDEFFNKHGQYLRCRAIGLPGERPQEVCARCDGKGTIVA